MKQRACPMYKHPKYVRRRRVALFALIGFVAAITFFATLAGDRIAEGVCVTQLDNKSEWAVQYSKERGQYPYE